MTDHPIFVVTLIAPLPPMTRVCLYGCREYHVDCPACEIAKRAVQMPERPA